MDVPLGDPTLAATGEIEVNGKVIPGLHRPRATVGQFDQRGQMMIVEARLILVIQRGQLVQGRQPPVLVASTGEIGAVLLGLEPVDTFTVPGRPHQAGLTVGYRAVAIGLKPTPALLVDPDLGRLGPGQGDHEGKDHEEGGSNGACAVVTMVGHNVFSLL